MRRKGLGLNLGKGYKNLLPIDSMIHGLSAKGVKTKPKKSKYQLSQQKLWWNDEWRYFIVVKNIFKQAYLPRPKELERVIPTKGGSYVGWKTKEEALKVLKKLNK